MSWFDNAKEALKMAKEGAEYLVSDVGDGMKEVLNDIKLNNRAKQNHTTPFKQHMNEGIEEYHNSRKLEEAYRKADYDRASYYDSAQRNNEYEINGKQLGLKECESPKEKVDFIKQSTSLFKGDSSTSISREKEHSREIGD